MVNKTWSRGGAEGTIFAWHANLVELCELRWGSHDSTVPRGAVAERSVPWSPLPHCSGSEGQGTAEQSHGHCGGGVGFENCDLNGTTKDSVPRDGFINWFILNGQFILKFSSKVFQTQEVKNQQRGAKTEVG